MKNKVEKEAGEHIELSAETHRKIINIYNNKMLGSKVLYLSLAIIITVIAIAMAIIYIPRAEIDITVKEWTTIASIAMVIILADIGVLSECIIVPRNIRNNKLRCIKAKITGKKEYTNASSKESEYLKYEIYLNNDAFRLACAQEFKHIDTESDLIFVYVKSAFTKNYLPLLAYKSDEKGLDYELLHPIGLSYDKFIKGEHTQSDSNTQGHLSYHDDLVDSNTSSIIELENKLEQAQPGSREQVKILEQIGEERHRLKKQQAKSKKLNKLKEIIEIIRK